MLLIIIFSIFSGYLAIKLTKKKYKIDNDDDLVLEKAIEDLDAMKYVRLILTEISKSNLNNVDILNKNGIAFCNIVNGIECEFTKVRNRMAILTSSVMPINSEVDRRGMAQFSFDGNKRDIEIEFGKNESIIKVLPRQRHSAH